MSEPRNSEAGCRLRVVNRPVVVNGEQIVAWFHVCTAAIAVADCAPEEILQWQLVPELAVMVNGRCFDSLQPLASGSFTQGRPGTYQHKSSQRQDGENQDEGDQHGSWGLRSVSRQCGGSV